LSADAGDGVGHVASQKRLLGMAFPGTSFLRALFGRGGAAEKPPEPVAYKGFVIRAAPYLSDGHYHVAGTIEREVDGVTKEHRFIRADAFGSYDDAVAFTLGKARQIVDLQGERMFG
jgi:hypothetical protein